MLRIFLRLNVNAKKIRIKKRNTLLFLFLVDIEIAKFILLYRKLFVKIPNKKDIHRENTELSVASVIYDNKTIRDSTNE